MTCLILTALLIAGIDRAAKYLILDKLSQGQSIEIIPKIFHLTLVLNTGAAFGIFKNGRVFFTASSLLVIALIVFYALYCRRLGLFLSIAMGLILGGAIGNLIDRLVFGHVIDFLDFRIWPVFNIADSSITIGAILLASKFLFDKKCFTT